jgi:hypothetical protein
MIWSDTSSLVTIYRAFSKQNTSFPIGDTFELESLLQCAVRLDTQNGRN